MDIKIVYNTIPSTTIVTHNLFRLLIYIVVGMIFDISANYDNFLRQVFKQRFYKLGANLVQNHVMASNYLLAKTIYRGWFSVKMGCKPPLLVYQMGKVGSTTVEHSLKATHLSKPIFHVHTLTIGGIEKAEELYYGKYRGVFRKSLLPGTRHLFISHYLRSKLETGRLDLHEKWKIVTLTRDPIARNISGFFEGITLRTPDFYERYKIGSIKNEDLIDSFLQKYNHDEPLIWFDTELKAVFGVDVYSESFPKSKNYKIYHGQLADVLVLRSEGLNRCYSDAFKEFLNLDEFMLINSNEASSKQYSIIYRNFLNSVVLPATYIDKMYTSKYVNHFYTEQEITTFKAKWCK